MARRTTWLVIGLLALVLAAGLAGWALGRGAGRARTVGAAPESCWRPADLGPDDTAPAAEEAWAISAVLRAQACR